MESHDEIRSRDAAELAALAPPVRRAAYSDRTAWLMATLAELAYIRFETSPLSDLTELAEDLAKASSASEIVARLSSLEQLLTSGPSDGEDVLRTILATAEFELIGTFYNRSLDPLKNTEGFVARRQKGDDRDFIVIAIRGTTSVQDWMNNAKAGTESIGGGRRVHKGFHQAYLDAKPQIDALIEQARSTTLPIFVTGHSLGGAVAVMSTWYLRRDLLSACYTFGAPRVGNHTFNDSFHTPIYRVVNAFDPVPLVPPSEIWIEGLKIVLGVTGKLVGGGVVDWIISALLKVQGYRHAGDLRHMTSGTMADDGTYPTVKFYTHFGVADRLVRLWHQIKAGKLKRLDTYHSMTIYRRKLRSRALARKPNT